MADFADSINYCLLDPNCRIVLQSNVDSVVGTHICDQITPRLKVSKQDDVTEPTCFAKVTLDTYCGLLVKRADLCDWLTIYGRNK